MRPDFFLTPGPASLFEGATNLRAAFGRGDKVYCSTLNRVSRHLNQITGHERLIAFQGSGSLANEIMIRNFLVGRVLVVLVGYYSTRLLTLANLAMMSEGRIQSVEPLDFENVGVGRADWVLACSVETGLGVGFPLTQLRSIADSFGAKLAVDAIASVGLEKNHDLADVITFSSCKGLFGITGGAFVASHDLPEARSNSFFLDYDTHLERKVTGPYHQLQSIDGTIRCRESLTESVLENKRIVMKRFHDRLIVEHSKQPIITTALRGRITGVRGVSRFVRYEPREMSPNTEVISSLGYTGRSALRNPYLRITISG